MTSSETFFLSFSSLISCVMPFAESDFLSICLK